MGSKTRGGVGEEEGGICVGWWGGLVQREGWGQHRKVWRHWGVGGTGRCQNHGEGPGNQVGVSEGEGIDEVPLPRPCCPRWLSGGAHLEALSPLHFVSGAPEHVADMPPRPRRRATIWNAFADTWIVFKLMLFNSLCFPVVVFY